MTIAGNSVSAATFKVDLTTITTNNSQRNRRVQQALETDQFPIATFKLTQPITLPADASSGGNVNVDAIGDLTLHGVTKHVTFPLQAQLVKGEVAVAGSMNVTFSDYGVAVPQSQIVLSVDDHGILELQMQLKRT
jgi:polyisoprenoid-binding protein YceI